MALKVPQSAYPSLFKEGYKHLQGLEEAVLRNIEATKALSDITQTSYGPNGRNKMVINHLERLFVTTDAATILRELEVVHPAAKLVVNASQQQDQEVGDGTNYVIMLAGELLQKAETLIRMGLHPSEILEGYDLALKKTMSLLDDLVEDEIEDIRDESELEKILLPTLASKQYGYEELLCPLIIQSCLKVLPKNPVHFNVDNIRTVKIMGGSIHDSKVIFGMVFNREPEGSAKQALDAKVAIYSCPLDISQTETKGTVLFQNAKELMQFSQGEESILQQQIEELHQANVKVVVTGGAVGDLMLHYFNQHGIVVVRVPSKFDIRRLCKVTGATALSRFGTPMAEEMGYCEFVETVEIGSDRVVVFRQEKEDTKTVSIVLRGATQNYLEDVDRCLEDGINLFKQIIKSPQLLAGAGAFEIELSKHLTSYAETFSNLNYHCIMKFAEVFQIFPKVLADTSGLDSLTLLSKLISAHHQEDGSCIGVDIENNEDGLMDVSESEIYDSYVVKKSAIQLACQAAFTILNIDQIIMSKPAGGPKMPKAPQQHWDQD